MKSVIIALLVCVPIFLILLAAHVYPLQTRSAIYLAEWEFEMAQAGAKAPPIVGDIRCKTTGTCPAESVALTARLQETFPAGTSEKNLRAMLIDQKFNAVGVNGAEYDWPAASCVHSVIINWASDNFRRLAKVNGHYILRCPWPLAGADFLLYKPSFNDISARRTDP